MIINRTELLKLTRYNVNIRFITLIRRYNETEIVKNGNDIGM